jgi:hypothetical protein
MSVPSDVIQDETKAPEVPPDSVPIKVRLRKPNSIVLDVYGVLTSHRFKQDLKQYIRDHLRSHLLDNWKRKRTRTLLRKLSIDCEQLIDSDANLPPIKYDEKWWDDESVKIAATVTAEAATAIDGSSGPTAVPEPEVKASPDKETIATQMEQHVLYRMNHRLYSDHLLLLWNEVWEAGYKSGQLKAHVYDEVPTILDRWRMHLFIKLYTLASGQSQGQKLFFKNTIGGDLTALIANYMDPSSIGKTNEKCYNAIVYALRDRPDNLVYLTDNISSKIHFGSALTSEASLLVLALAYSRSPFALQN